jgi:hypothetical protein
MAHCLELPMSAVNHILEVEKKSGSQLIELLGNASKGVEELRVHAECICESGNLENLGYRRQPLEGLCQLLAKGGHELGDRINCLDASAGVGNRESNEKPISHSAACEHASFIGSYRSCCRHLCKAMTEAIRDSDSASVLMLRNLIMRLEKQLWTIDSPSRNHGLDDSRTVALFLSC